MYVLICCIFRELFCALVSTSLMLQSLNHDDPDIARASYDLLIHCIALGDGWWAALRNVLILLPYNANLDFFYRLVYPLL